MAEKRNYIRHHVPGGWLQTERANLSGSSPVAETIEYLLKRWDGFTSFLDDGRICSRTMLPGESRAASPDQANKIDPQALLADVLARLPATPITNLQQLLPRDWQPDALNAQAA